MEPFRRPEILDKFVGEAERRARAPPRPQPAGPGAAPLPPVPSGPRLPFEPLQVRALFAPAEEEWAVSGDDSALHVIILDEMDGKRPPAAPPAVPPAAWRACACPEAGSLDPAVGLACGAAPAAGLAEPRGGARGGSDRAAARFS